jgi:peroxiredoxin
MKDDVRRPSPPVLAAIGLALGVVGVVGYFVVALRLGAWLPCAIAGVVVDTPETNADLSRQVKLDYPILSDPSLHTVDAYELRHAGGGPDGQNIARSASVLVDGAGVVRWTFVTRNFRVRPTPADVLAAIDALPPGS